MADIDLKTETPDASINDSAILFGADSQASANPSVYSVATVRSHFVGAGTLNVASGKTLTASNTLTLAGTDGTTMTFPTTSATLARTDAGNTFTGNQTLGSSDNLNWNSDTLLTRRGAANLRLGEADTGSTTATVTITIATPGVVTWTGHGLSTGTPVFFTTTGALPTGITASTTYYVIAVDANTFQIATSFANALAGTAVNTSGSQSGTQTGNRNAITQRLSVQSVTGVADRIGSDFLIQGSQGTGNGVGGSIIFQVARPGTAGQTTSNTFRDALRITPTTSGASIAVPGSGSGASFGSPQGAVFLWDNGGSWSVDNFSQIDGNSRSSFTATGGVIGVAGLGIGSAVDVRLTRRGAANLRLGAADAAGSAIAISSVASNQLTLASNHGLTTGAAVIITGTAAPSGASLNTLYYARNISAAVLELYDTYQNAITTASTTGRIAVTTAGTSASINRATPFQQLSVQSFTGTDIPGQPFVITGSQGTGTGRGGDIIFQVAPAGTTGSTQNALATALTIIGDGRVGIGSTVNNTTLGVTTSLTLANWLFFSGTGGIVFDSGSQNTVAQRNLGGFNNLVLAAESTNAILSGGTTGWSALGGRVNSGGEFTWSSVTHDALLYAFANSDLVEQRRRNNGQTFRVYGRYTSDTNFERFFVASSGTSGSAVQLGTQKGSGGGTACALELQTDGTTRLTIAATTGNITTTGSVTTEAPTGGTAAAWRLGIAATVSPTSPNRTIEVDIGGTIYYIAAKTTND